VLAVVGPVDPGYNRPMPLNRALVVALVVAAGHVGCRKDAAPSGASTAHDPAAHGSAAHGSAAPPAPAPGSAAAPALPPGNVVQTEMRLMTTILEATVRGIGARDVRGIDHELHRLHAAKEATAAAVRDGSYKLPKNPDQVATFETMDEAFHKHLEALVYASRDNDVPRAAEALGAILRGCEGCHATFRP